MRVMLIREHLQPKVQKLEVYFKLFSFKRTHACCPCENALRKRKRREDEKTERKPAIYNINIGGCGRFSVC